MKNRINFSLLINIATFIQYEGVPKHFEMRGFLGSHATVYRSDWIKYEKKGVFSRDKSYYNLNIILEPLFITIIFQSGIKTDLL